jgi:Saccharopine dehydrogenase NADP binding domain
MVSIGVYGASGYTGRFVTAQLVARGHHVVLGGRDSARLAEAASTLSAGCEIHPAQIDDPEALRHLAKRCAVVINCAGPFSRYGQPVAEAAIAAGVHYLDHTSEPAYVHRLMRELDGSARRAGSVIVAGMSFYTGFADLIVHRLAERRAPLLRVAIAYAIEGWQLTPGSLSTAAAIANTDRVLYRDDALQVLPPHADMPLGEYPFPLPIGVQPVIAEYPGCCEPVTVPRHTRTGAVETYMTVATFAGTGLTPHTPATPEQPPRDGPTRFTIVVDAYTRTDQCRGWISGVGDLYEIGALISVQAAERLAAGEATTTGVLSPAEVFAENGLLDALVAMRFVHGGLHEETTPIGQTGPFQTEQAHSTDT